MGALLRFQPSDSDATVEDSVDRQTRTTLAAINVDARFLAATNPAMLLLAAAYLHQLAMRAFADSEPLLPFMF